MSRKFGKHPEVEAVPDWQICEGGAERRKRLAEHGQSPGEFDERRVIDTVVVLCTHARSARTHARMQYPSALDPGRDEN